MSLPELRSPLPLTRHDEERIDLGHFEQPSEHGRAPIYADSQVGLLVGHLVARRNNTLSVQLAIDILERKGRPSNDTARRLREARSFLRARGIKTTVKKSTSRYGTVPYNVYAIEWDESRVLEVRELLKAHPHINNSNNRRQRVRGGRS